MSPARCGALLAGGFGLAGCTEPERVYDTCPMVLGPALALDAPTPWGPTPEEIVAADSGQVEGSWTVLENDRPDVPPVETTLTYAVTALGTARLYEVLAPSRDPACEPRWVVEIPARLSVTATPGLVWSAEGALWADALGGRSFAPVDPHAPASRVDEEIWALLSGSSCGGGDADVAVVLHPNATYGPWTFEAAAEGRSDASSCSWVPLSWRPN